MSRPTQLHIDLPALQHNYNRIKSFAPHSSILAMVKANAYGHGLTQIALALPQADGFGVACSEEALILRAAGVKQRIVLMEGFFNASELAAISAQHLDIVVHHMAQVEALEAQRLANPVTVWLKIDTGMHRLGFLPSQVNTVWQRLRACASVKPDICVMTHFAVADQTHNTMTQQQINDFTALTKSFTAEKSLANSAAILAWPQAQQDWIRPGLILYGVAPFADKINADYDLRPVMTLSSEIIAMHQLRKGDTVGYGATVCPRDMLVGVVAIGYGDGYPWHAKQGTPILVNGKIAPLIGRVSMDMLTVDLNTQPMAKVGDPVVLWGAGLPVEQVAQHTASISYDLLCGIAQRVRVG